MKKKTIVALGFAVLLLLVTFCSPLLAEKWSFAVIADNRSAFDSYRNVLQEIKTMSVNPDPRFAPIEFILACGDLDPVDRNYDIYAEVFESDAPAFFPVRGNHEGRRDVRFILNEILPAYGNRIHTLSPGSVNYYTDWKNVRLIVLDQYFDSRKGFDGKATLTWLENAIQAATDADHVFITFHEPYSTMSLIHDAFWNLLLEHRDKVRAVFAGHTHWFDRERFPDQEGGIYYINAGNAGNSKHSDRSQTIVEVMVDGPVVHFRALKAPDGTNRFKVTDRWQTEAPDNGRPVN